ncbi:hypothetical protein M5689_000197 [Euphorbia peplus]|nr:hypothetical protein M5689_000197 [Euphorbia peplus]
MDDYFMDTEEDVFYNELRKQMLLLTEDDDEGYDDLITRRSSRRSTEKAIKPAGNYFNWWEIENGNSDPTPTWLVNLWRNKNGGSGTGVFIPQILISSRSGKKKNNGRRRIYKKVQNNQ